MRRSSIVWVKWCGAGLVSMILLEMPPSWSAAAELDKVLIDGKTMLDIRYRYESADQSNNRKNADASTLCTRLGYSSGDFYGATANLEFENVTVIGAAAYNSGANGKTAYSAVPDPAGSRVDQADLTWAAR